MRVTSQICTRSAGWKLGLLCFTARGAEGKTILVIRIKSWLLAESELEKARSVEEKFLVICYLLNKAEILPRFGQVSKLNQSLGHNDSMMRSLISVIIPVFDEGENLDDLASRLQAVFDRSTSCSFEVIFVDDGSRDGSSEVLDRINERDGRYKVIHFSRNFGHQAALQAGLDASAGNAVVLMDADLQDPPELIEEFLRKWAEGYEVVYAIRQKRKESLWKRTAYKIFYRTLRLISEIDAPLDAGDF